MRSFNPIDPFSLDEPDVRLPAGTSMFDTLPPVGKLIDDLENLGVDVPDAARWRDLAAATQPAPGPQSTPDLDFTPEQVATYIRESAALASTDTVPARQRAAKALDRAQPVAHILANDGRGWRDYGVEREGFLRLVGARVERGAPRLWGWLWTRAERYFS